MSNPFDPTTTQQAVHQTLDAALSAIPEGHNHAVLIDGSKTRDGGQAELLYATRITKGETLDWTFAIGVTYDGHDVGGGVATKISWK